MRIIYKKPDDAVEFDYDRYIESLRRYGEIDEVALKNALDELRYDPCHVSVLVELGVQAFQKDEDARKYFEEHKADGRTFERLRRICGYLVGSLDRWNSAKRQEESMRLKHSVGQFTVKEKIQRETQKRDGLNTLQDEYHRGTCADC